MGEQLAMRGGTPVRTLPFGPSHYFGDEDIEALSEVIRSGALGKGPKVRQFEEAFAARPRCRPCGHGDFGHGGDAYVRGCDQSGSRVMRSS